MTKETQVRAILGDDCEEINAKQGVIISISHLYITKKKVKDAIKKFYVKYYDDCKDCEGHTGPSSTCDALDKLEKELKLND